jgi:HEAT repeat protein
MRALHLLLCGAIVAAIALPGRAAPARLGVSDKKEWKQLKKELAPRLGGDDHEKRNRAIYKLGRADWPDAVKMLLKLLKQPDPKSDALVTRFDKLTSWIIPLEKKAMANGGKLPINEANNHRSYIAEQKEIRNALTALAGLKRTIVDALGDARREECITLITAALDKERDAVVRANLLLALSQIPGDAPGAAIRAAVTQDDSPYARAAAITALGTKQGKKDLALLLGALDDEAWPVRAAAVDAVRALGSSAVPAAIEPLIGMLETEAGRLKGDVADCLSHLCGKAIGPDAELWRSWYAANKEKVRARNNADSFGEPLSGGKEEAGHGTTASFYGIKTTSKRIAFVVDLSGSMTRPATVPKDAAGRPTGGAVSSGRAGKGSPPADDPSMQPLPADPTRLDVVKRELMKAIWTLPEDAIFALVGYHTEAQLMGRGTQKATASNKKAVGKMVASWTADGGTNTYDALELALALGQDRKRADKKFDEGVDTIFLLSDGLPSFGKVSDPDEIVATIVDKAKKRRLRIHTIWVGAPSGGNGPNAGRANEMGERFMRGLAEGTGGQFVKR